MLFTFRVALPDRPGALSQLTSLIASYEIDVRAIDVLGGKLSQAVDQFLLEGAAASIDDLVDELRSTGTFTVLGVRRAGIMKEHAPELTVVQAVAKEPDRALAILTEAAPQLLDADWALGFESGFADWRARTPSAPVVQWGGRVPMRSSRVTGQGLFTVDGHAQATMVMAPIPEFGVVLVGRNDGMVFHDTEVFRLQQLMMTIDLLISATGLRIRHPSYAS